LLEEKIEEVRGSRRRHQSMATDFVEWWFERPIYPPPQRRRFVWFCAVVVLSAVLARRSKSRVFVWIDVRWFNLRRPILLDVCPESLGLIYLAFHDIRYRKGMTIFLGHAAAYPSADCDEGKESRSKKKRESRTKKPNYRRI